MQKIKLGRTDLMVSRLAYGTGLMGHLHAELPPKRAADILKRAFELGVTFWDTADFYQTHEHVREGLRGLDRQSIVLATKTSARLGVDAADAIERFLRELGTDYLDLVYLHGVNTPAEFKARRAALEALLLAKERGLIRSIGLSTHSVATACVLPELAKAGIEVGLVVLNKTGHNLDGGTVTEMEGAAQQAYDSGLGVCTMKVLGQGQALHQHTVEELIGHNLSLAYTHSLVIGMNSIDEVEQNVEIVERLDTLPDDSTASFRKT